MKKNKFSLIDSGIPDATGEVEMRPIKLEAFFSNSKERPLLIWCKRSKVDHYVNAAADHFHCKMAEKNTRRVYRTNLKDIKTLRSLDR